MTVLMVYFYLSDGNSLSSPYLLFIAIGVGGSARNYFKYRKLNFQQGREFISDRN